MSYIDDIASAAWSHEPRTLVVGTPGEPSSWLDEVAEAVWSHHTRTLTGSGLTSVCTPSTVTGSRTTLQLHDEQQWGVYSDIGSPLRFDFLNENLGADPSFHDGRHTIAGGRSARAGLRGRVDVGGSVVGSLQPHGAWPIILRHTLGIDVSTSPGIGDTFEHEILGQERLPAGLTLSKTIRSRGGAVRTMRFRGSRVDDLVLTFPRDGEVQARANIFAGPHDILETEDDIPEVSLDNVPFASHHGAILIDLDQDETPEQIGAIVDAELTIANGLNSGNYRVRGNGYRSSVPIGVRNITGRMTIRLTEESFGIFERCLENASMGLVMGLSRVGAGGVPYSVTMTMPKVRIRGTPAPKVGGAGTMILNAAFRAEYDSGIGSDIRVVVVNNDPRLSTLPLS